MEILNSVDQKRLARIKQLFADHAVLFARQASVVETWRKVDDRRLGPYFALRYREGRRQLSLYLGKSPNLAAEVRALLLTAQRPRREQLALDRIRQAVKFSLREQLCMLRAELAKVGLKLHGSEVRGWRHAQFTDAWNAVENPQPASGTADVPRT